MEQIINEGEFQVNDNRGESVDVSVVDNKDGTFNCAYKPQSGSKHTVQVRCL